MPEIDLYTPRLHLRPVTLDDSTAVQRYFNNWNIIKYIGGEVPWPYPEDGARDHIKGILKKLEVSNGFLWGLVIKDSKDEIVGVIEYRLDSVEDDNRGFWLAEPFWGRGIMTEAVVATQDYVLNELGVERIVAKNAESNIGSRKIKIRCGAEKIDHVPGKYHSGDVWEEVWEIRRDQWMRMGSDPSLEKYRSGGT